MQANLTLDTIIAFESTTHINKEVKLGKILYEIKREFPDGFYGRQATQFLHKNLNGIPKGFGGSPYGYSTGRFYKSLVEVGYLERLENKDKKIIETEESSNKSKKTYLYKVKESLPLEQYQSETVKIRPHAFITEKSKFEDESEYELRLPTTPILVTREFARLLRSYSMLTATPENEFNADSREGLEKMVLENKNFLSIMILIRENFPKAYASFSGQYLDKLKQTLNK